MEEYVPCVCVCMGGGIHRQLEHFNYLGHTCKKTCFRNLLLDSNHLKLVHVKRIDSDIYHGYLFSQKKTLHD